MKPLIKLLTLISLLTLQACASPSPQVEEDTTMNLESMNQFFDEQKKCMEYINVITHPAVDLFSKESRIEGIREWVAKHKTDQLSILILKVQADTYRLGKINPTSKSDQKIIFSSLNKIIQLDPNFISSACGSDVQEYVNEALYLGVGGENSKVAAQLARNGVEGSWEQRWALTALLMAGQISIK